MKSLSLPLALAPALLFAQTEAPSFHFDATLPQVNTVNPSWAGAAVYDFKTKEVDLIIINSTFALTKRGKPTGVYGSLFGGTTTDKAGHSLAGAMVNISHQLFDQVGVTLGLGGDIHGGGGGFHFVIEGGATIKF